MPEDPKPTTDPKDPITIEDKNLKFEYAQLKQGFDELRIKYDALVTAHQRVLAHIDEGNRAVLMSKLAKMTKLTKEEMTGMDTAELQRLVDSYSLLKQPIAGVKPAGDAESEPESRLFTVPNKFRYGPKE